MPPKIIKEKNMGLLQDSWMANVLSVTIAAGKIHAPNVKKKEETITAGDLEKEMRFFLLEWQIQAFKGLTNFGLEQLERRVNELESGNVSAFLDNIAGNGLWAATVFVKEGNPWSLFAVSMVGILIAASSTTPSDSKSFIKDINDKLESQIDSLFDQLEQNLSKKVELLLKHYHHKISMNHALSEFLMATFMAEVIIVDSSHASRPKMKGKDIADYYNQVATKQFDKVMAEYKQKNSIGQKLKEAVIEFGKAQSDTKPMP